MTPDAKKGLSSTIRGLRQRLLEDLRLATESAYRLSLRPQEAEQQAAHTLLNRLVILRLMEEPGPSGQHGLSALLSARGACVEHLFAAYCFLLFMGYKLMNGAASQSPHRISFSKVPLVGRHVLDATVAMLAVVPLHKAFNPMAHGIQVAKPAQRVALVILTTPRDCVYIVLNSDSA